MKQVAGGATAFAVLALVVNGGAVLIAMIAVLALAVWGWDRARHPHKIHGSCRGSGERWSSLRKNAVGSCGPCSGSGRQRRWL